MKKFCLILLLCTFCAFAKNAPINLREYYESGKYFNEIEKSLVEAKEYLDRQLQHPRQNRLAIVLDIDETALTHYRYLEQSSFTYHPQAMIGAFMLGGAQPITPVLNLYQHAISHKVAVFFVSERPNTPEIMSATIKNLKAAGFDQWEQLILKPIDQTSLSVKDFKTNARSRIALEGYDIILNIGDQEADLQGGYAEAKVRLANPFYETSLH